MDSPDEGISEGLAGALSFVRTYPSALAATKLPPPAGVLAGGNRERADACREALSDLLAASGLSLAVSTYTANRLLVLSADRESRLTLKERMLPSPMGVTVRGNRLAVGTKSGVVEYESVSPPPGEPGSEPGRHDVCYVPRRMQITGDIRVHDMGYAGVDLWMVATRFSCLATLDTTYSFLPRWRPPWVSRLAPDDRTHLNGLAVSDGQPRFVTSLGVSDEPGGWRASMPGGGVIVDVGSGEIVCRQLLGPHSPRWYRDRLWVLESLTGELVAVDAETGARVSVARVPGFARGLAFSESLAFIGVSRHRPSGIGVHGDEVGGEKVCGVWVVDISTGATVAQARFGEPVNEIFDVAVLRGLRSPELADLVSRPTDYTFLLPPDEEA